LGEDIIFLNDYLKLEEIRRDNFSFSIESNVKDDITIPPMIFIPFVENAIKHNHDSNNLSYIRIDFGKWDKGIVFRCINSKPFEKKAGKSAGGIGLNNIRRRLALLYPSSHELIINESGNEYSVTLKLEI